MSSKSVLLILVCGMLFFVFCCSGAFAPRERIPTESKTVETVQKKDLVTTTQSSSTSDESTYLKILEKRMDEYRNAKSHWDEEFARLESQIQNAKKQIELAESRKPVPPETNTEREWRSSDGKFSTLGTMVANDYSSVTIQKSDGSFIDVDKKRLSDSDKRHIESTFVEDEVYRKQHSRWETEFDSLSQSLHELKNQYEKLRELPPKEPTLDLIKKEIEDDRKRKMQERLLAQEQINAEQMAQRERKAERQRKEAEERSQAIKLANEANALAFMLVLKSVDPEGLIFRTAYADDRTLTIVVTNYWHLRLYQIRLQDAQLLQRLWAKVYCPSDPDTARITIVDVLGNEVGGSRIWGGTMIWVQKE
jgi:hypothetical protein